jgi:N-acetylglucosaminyldiphosphoundecaprenol N-acetyl-beta-D-mannosaminyltransferase
MFIGKNSILSIKLSACDHDFILKEIQNHIKQEKSFLISPLASQTLVLAYFDKKLNSKLKKYDHLFSDSIWVKRAINFLYKIGLKDRVRGSNLLLEVCRLAQKKEYKVFLYGTTAETLRKLKGNLLGIFPRLKIVGCQPSNFRDLSLSEKQYLITAVQKARTDILLLALGSPLEQVFSCDLLYNNPKFTKPIVIIPFGAAFDFISGVKPTAPLWMQKLGLEWFFRFICEPRRLWKRYLIYGLLFVFLVFRQKLIMLFNLADDVVVEGKVSG